MPYTDTDLAATQFMRRYPRARLEKISLTSKHPGCSVLVCESSTFIQTDDLKYLVGVGPVVIDHHNGECFPFLSDYGAEKAVQNWRRLSQENQTRAARGAAQLMTDTTKHPFTFSAAAWVLRHIGWGGFKRMMDVAGDVEGIKSQHLNGHHRIGDVFRLNETLAPGEVFGDHVHQKSPILLQVFFDTATVHIAGNQREVPAGENITIQPGQPFRIENTSSGKVKLLLLSSAV